MQQDDHGQFEQRKQDHIDLALLPVNQANEHQAFDDIELVHEALPDCDFDDIQLSGMRFGLPVSVPFFVSSMTAGHKGAVSINRHLVEACAESGWAMGVGSQRRELSDTKAASEWLSLRKDFPNVSLFGNLGIAQLLTSSHIQIEKLVESLQASALIIHCNPLQEVIQPEGTPQFKGCWQALEKLVKALSIPVVVKETGCGFSVPTLQRLDNIGVTAVDVSGLGGTHWGRIEGARAKALPMRMKTAETFKNWGINTVKSVLNARSINPGFEIWGSGGVRNGLDAAKLIALGATSVGFAKPMLEAALCSSRHVYNLMLSIEYELRVALFCTGSRLPGDLKEKLCL